MKVVAFDTETKGFNWWDPNQRAFLATWADETGGYCADLANPTDINAFTKALEGAEVLVAHNLSFDAHQVRETLGLDVFDLDCRLEDTDLLSRVVEVHERTHGLKDMSTRLTGRDGHALEEKIEERMKQLKIKKSDAASYYEVHRAYPEDMRAYAIADAVDTRDSYLILEPKLTEKSRVIYEREMNLVPTIMAAERRGVLIDQGAVARLRAEYEPEEEYLREKVTQTLEVPLTGDGSRDGLIDALLDHGVPLHRRTEKTQVLRTDKFALQEFEKDFPILADLAEWRRVSKFIATYLDPMGEADPYLHTSFYQCEAWTHRMSSRRPNLQNLPKKAGKEVRAPIVPRPGHAFIVADYEGIEARVMAWFLGDPDYRELVAKRDPHAWLASQVWGGAVEDYHKGTEKEPMRDDAKNVTYAIGFGAGGPRVADMLNIPLEQARSLVQQIKSSIPGFRKLNKRIQRKVKAVGYVTTIDGRDLGVNREKAYVGMAALIQGTAAGIMKKAIEDLAPELPAFDAHLVLMVHDEVLVEVPIPQAEACQAKIVEVMEAAWPLDPPLSVDSKIVTTNYADAK